MNTNHIKKKSKQLIYILENSLNLKTIRIKNSNKYENNHYLRNFLTFADTYNILSKNIIHSQIYKKIIKII